MFGRIKSSIATTTNQAKKQLRVALSSLIPPRKFRSTDFQDEQRLFALLRLRGVINQRQTFAATARELNEQLHEVVNTGSAYVGMQELQTYLGKDKTHGIFLELKEIIAWGDNVSLLLNQDMIEKLMKALRISYVSLQAKDDSEALVGFTQTFTGLVNVTPEQFFQNCLRLTMLQLLALCESAISQYTRGKPQWDIPHQNNDKLMGLMNRHVALAKIKEKIGQMRDSRAELEAASQERYKDTETNVKNLYAHTQAIKHAHKCFKEEAAKIIQEPVVEYDAQKVFSAYEELQIAIQAAEKIHERSTIMHIESEIVDIKQRFGVDRTTEISQLRDAAIGYIVELKALVNEKDEIIAHEKVGTFLYQQAAANLLDVMKTLFGQENIQNFWNKKVACGLSRASINGIRVPIGVAKVAKVLKSENLSVSDALVNINYEIKARIKAGSEFLGFWCRTKRNQATSDVYHLVAGSIDKFLAQTLTLADVEELKVHLQLSRLATDSLVNDKIPTIRLSNY